MELKKLGKKTYIIDGLNKVGIYLIDKTNVILIDTGLDEKAAKKILNICKEANWKISMILNTHAHTDHIGGNNYLQNKLNIPIYAKKIEKALIENQELGAALVWGGFLPNELNNKYVLAPNSKVEEIKREILPKGLEMIELPGHNGDMIGFKTSDNIFFLSDAIAGENIISKYKLQFIFDIENYLITLDYINDLKGDVFIPTHGNVFKKENLSDVIELNRKTLLDNIKNIKEICSKKKTFENILSEVFYLYNLKMDFIQYCFISATIKSYLTYMLNHKMLKVCFKDNKMLWETT